LKCQQLVADRRAVVVQFELPINHYGAPAGQVHEWVKGLAAATLSLFILVPT